MNEDQKNKIIRALKDKGIPLKDIAKRLYISEYQLKILLRNWGVELPKRRSYKKMPMPDRSSLMELYNKYGSVDKVAKYFGVGYSTIARWMKTLEIPSRKLTGMTDEEKAGLLEKHIGRLDKINL
ncbi:MAG: hypothetical protein HYS87_02875 [Candidatus Colwellbacteria bacterium]|nr:hypothetical protein [Candidatus Colwellbacteria bacterium]